MIFYDMDSLAEKQGIENKYLLTAAVAAWARTLSEQKGRTLEEIMKSSSPPRFRASTRDFRIREGRRARRNGSFPDQPMTRWKNNKR